jgi:hypothetical protein
MAWAAGADPGSPPASAEPSCPSRLTDLFFEDLVDPPPPRASSAWPRASSLSEATRVIERPPSPFLLPRWCQRTTWPLSAGEMVTSGGVESGESSIMRGPTFWLCAGKMRPDEASKPEERRRIGQGAWLQRNCTASSDSPAGRQRSRPGRWSRTSDARYWTRECLRAGGRCCVKG